MKIAIVIARLDPARGGKETWTAGLAPTLVARGHDVHVYAQACALTAPPFHFHPVAVDTVTRAGRITQFGDAAAAAVAGQGFDIVHDQGDGWYGNVLEPHGGAREATVRQNLMIETGRLGGFKRWVSLRATSRARALARLAGRQFDPNVRREWIAVSCMVRDHLRRFYSVPEERIHVVYNGVDLKRFHPDLRAGRGPAVRQSLGISPNETVFLLVAHNFRLKGVAELIQGAARLAARRQDFHVVVAGGGRAPEYERLARRAGCAERVWFLGPTDDVASIYACADAYVHPTYYDPCSLVVLEALACGLPVVTTRYNGASELLTEGVDGYVIGSPRDAAGLAVAMEMLMDRVRRHTMSQAARELAEQHAIERNHDEVVAVYEAALKRSPLEQP